MSEHTEQVALFQWAAVFTYKYSVLGKLFAIPNGGQRHKAVAAKLKAEGVKAGVPDICLPVARGGYHALYIELKVGKNKPTKDQERWLQGLNNEGNKAVWCTGWDAARKIIINYLEGEF